MTSEQRLGGLETAGLGEEEAAHAKALRQEDLGSAGGARRPVGCDGGSEGEVVAGDLGEPVGMVLGLVGAMRRWPTFSTNTLTQGDRSHVSLTEVALTLGVCGALVCAWGEEGSRSTCQGPW